MALTSDSVRDKACGSGFSGLVSVASGTTRGLPVALSCLLFPHIPRPGPSARLPLPHPHGCLLTPPAEEGPPRNQLSAGSCSPASSSPVSWSTGPRPALPVPDRSGSRWHGQDTAPRSVPAAPGSGPAGQRVQEVLAQPQSERRCHWPA